MGEIKDDETTKNGAVDLEEQELGEVTGGLNAIKIPNIFSGDSGFSDPNAPIKDLKINDIRLPKGSIRAGKVK